MQLSISSIKIFLVSVLLFTCYAANAQKIYVWCPENNKINPRIGLRQNDTVRVVLFDGRSTPPKSKIECSSEQVMQTIFDQLKSAYPSTILVRLPEQEYYKRHHDSNAIIVKIGIAAYNAGFGTDISAGIGSVGGHFATMIYPSGQWNAVASYYVQIFIGEKGVTKEISNLSSKSNLWGYKSAKNALNECYNKSIAELLLFIDEQLSN